MIDFLTKLFGLGVKNSKMEIKPQVRPNVLCIEAFDLILTWVVPLLERHGCHVIQASDLTTAQSIIQQNRPLDLVLLGDIGRPNRESSNVAQAELTLLTTLRRSDSYRSIPIIIFTSQNWLTVAKEAGATDHLVKPAGVKELEATIVPHLKKAQ